MNGYSLMAESYAKASIEGKIPQDEATKKVKVFSFLASCDQDDIFTLFDSTAFNEVVMSYIRKAVAELVDEDTLTDEEARAVRNRVRTLFSEKTAQEISNE